MLNNPVLETAEGRESEGEKSKDEAEVDKEKEEALAELIRERGYDDISYRQADYGREDKGYSYEQYISSEVTLSEHLLFQLQFASNNKASVNLKSIEILR